MATEGSDEIVFEEEDPDTKSIDKTDIAEEAMENIFENCDPENTGYAAVSTLIEFMTPYMQDDLEALEILKIWLDPIGIDQKVTKETFCTVMNKWSQDQWKSKNALELSLTQSDPKDHESDDNDCRIYNLEDNSNLLNRSVFSCGSTPSSLVDSSFEKQSQIENFKLQIKKLLEDNTDLKSQLTVSEECNTNLQQDIIKITRELEKKTGIEKKIKKQFEEAQEVNLIQKQEIEKLQQKFTHLKNENIQLKRNNQQLNEKNNELLESIEMYKEKNEELTELLGEAKFTIIKLEDELNEKEISIQNFQDQVNHFQEKIKFLENTIMFMRAEKKEQQSNSCNPTISQRRNDSDTNFNGTSNKNNINNKKSSDISINTLKSPFSSAPREHRYIHIDTPISLTPFRMIDTPLKSLIDNPISPLSHNTSENSQLHLKRLFSLTSSTPSSYRPRNLNNLDLHSSTFTFAATNNMSTIDFREITGTSYESAIGSSSDDSKLYSFIMDDHVPVKSSLLNELKEATQENTEVDHIFCTNKLKDLEAKFSNLEQEYNNSQETRIVQESTIINYEKQIEELKTMVSTLQDNIDCTTVEIRTRDNEILSLHEEINTLVQAKETLLLEKNMLIDENKDQENRLRLLIGNYETEIIKFKNILEKINSSNITSLESDAEDSTDIKRKLECITNNLKLITDNYEKLKLDNNLLKKNYQISLENLYKCEENLKQLKLELQNKKQKITHLKREIDEKSIIINKFENDIKIKDEHINDLISKNISSKKELERISLENNTKEDQLVTFNVQLKSINNELEQKSQLIIKLKNELEKSRTIQLTAVEIDKLHKIELEHKLCQQNENRLKNKIEQLVLKLKKLKTKLSTDKNYNSKLKRKIIALENSLKHSEMRMNEIHIKYDSIEKQCDTLKRENNDLKIQTQKLQNTRKQILNDSNEIISDECQKFVQVETELNSYKIKYSKLEENFISLQTEYTDLVNDLRTKSVQHANIATCDKFDRKSKLIKQRKIEKLEDKLENESTKKQELITKLDKINSEKSLLELKITQNENVYRDENKRMQEQITKFNSYLFETSSYLNKITKETMNKISHEISLKIEWDDCYNIIKFHKERYYEPVYSQFHRNLCQCIYLLKILVNISSKQSVFGDGPPDFSIQGISNFHLNSSKDESEVNVISLQLNNLYIHQSAPPSPKFKSKFVYRIPDNSGRLIFSSRNKSMAETYPIIKSQIESSSQSHVSSIDIELNNNVASDRKPIYQRTAIITKQKATTQETEGDGTESNLNQILNTDSSNNVTVINVANVIPESDSTKDLTTATIDDCSAITDDIRNTVRRFSNMSISASSTNSGSTESLSIDNEQSTLTDDLRNNLRAALDEVLANKQANNGNYHFSQPTTVHERLFARNILQYDRSRSQSLNNSEEIDIFPSISDTFLENLNLTTKADDDSPKEEICEQDEIEKKFFALSLAFDTDAATLLIRREQLQKYRGQAERNLQFEVERLTQSVHKLNPLCIDAERTELVSGLLSQIDILIEAARHASVSAQCFGAVHQEWRLHESIKLMLRYVENVKLQRDAARRHFQYTRRMLQESTSSEAIKSAAGNQQKISPSSSINNNNNSHNRLMTRRRASIATISRPQSGVENLRTIANRRPSPSPHADMQTTPRRLETLDRLNSLSVVRSARQSKAELATEHLQNIHENREAESSDISDSEDNQLSKSINDTTVTDSSQLDEVRHKFGLIICNFFRRNFGDSLHTSGLLHEICITSALICFFIATMNLAWILLEIQYARQGIPVVHIPWSWATWEEMFHALFPISTSSSGPRPT